MKTRQSWQQNFANATKRFKKCDKCKFLLPPMISNQFPLETMPRLLSHKKKKSSRPYQSLPNNQKRKTNTTSTTTYMKSTQLFRN